MALSTTHTEAVVSQPTSMAGEENILINNPQGSGYEMNSFQDNANPFQDSSEVRADPNAILNECKDIDRGIEQVESNLDQLRVLQQRTLDDADNSASSTANQQLDSLSTDTMALYRSLTERVRQVKSKPDAQSPKNKPQVSRVDRRLKAAIQQYQSVESQFRKRTQDQMARQYRIVRPDATEEQIRQVVEDPNGAQVFSQALMQSDRQGRARAALSAVQDRHRALQKIEQQMVELSQLFQDMDTLVVQQEEMVTDIEHKAEDVVESLEHGNKEIGVAVETARATRRKKFWCALICRKYARYCRFKIIANFAQLPSWSSSPLSSLSSLRFKASLEGRSRRSDLCLKNSQTSLSAPSPSTLESLAVRLRIMIRPFAIEFICRNYHRNGVPLDNQSDGNHHIFTWNWKHDPFSPEISLLFFMTTDRPLRSGS